MLPFNLHDCEGCELKAVILFQDVYYCHSSPSWVIRKSSDPSDYESSSNWTFEDAVLIAAKLR